MRLGVWCPLPHTIRPEPRLDAAIAELCTPGAASDHNKMLGFAIDTLQRAEKLGFETSLIAERWLGPDPSAWMFGAALAMATRNIELMIAVHPGIVQPQQVAKLGATLDRISNGRAAINIVNGWWEEEFSLFSNGATQADPASRYRRMEEYCQVLRGLWERGPFEFHGEFYTVASSSLPLKCVRQPGLPLYAGTRSQPGMDVIAKHGDVWFVSYEGGIQSFDANLAKVRADIAKMRLMADQYGRTLDFGISCHVICAHSDDEARGIAEEFESQATRSRMAFVAAKALGAGLTGSAQTLARRMSDYHDAGVSVFMLHFHPMIEGMEYFVREVMPLVEHQMKQAGRKFEGKKHEGLPA